MVSMNCKRKATIATLAASLLMTGGAAFASPATASARNVGPTASLVPGPVDKAIETVRNTESDVHNQISQLPKNPLSKAAGTVRNTEADVHNKLSELSKIR